MDDIVTKEEAGILLKFRHQIADLLPGFNDYQKQDIWLLRWLRARDLNLNKAEEMLRKSLKWREDKKIDDYVKWEISDYVDQTCSCRTPGFDKDGSIVIAYGLWDVKKICAMGCGDRLLEYAAIQFENMMKYLEFCTTKDRYIHQFVAILDFKHFSLTQLASKQTIELVMNLIQIFEDNYPETLKSAWVLNAPKYFEILYTFVKPLLSAKTIAKVHIHGTVGYREQLLKAVDAYQLSSQYGGALTSVPEYRPCYGFLDYPAYEIFPEEEMTEIFLGAGMKHTITHSLPIGMSMSWNFKTQDYDIGYLVEYQQPESEAPPIILFSGENVDAHLHVQTGAIVAERCGDYSLVLDNTKSRFRGKYVRFGVRVKPNGPMDGFWYEHCARPGNKLYKNIW